MKPPSMITTSHYSSPSVHGPPPRSRSSHRRNYSCYQRCGSVELYLVGKVFIACGVASSGGKDDLYCKPKTGMWQLMKKHFNSGIEIDMDKSFYVGDAAGRKGNHSDAYIKFAQVNGLKFYTREEYLNS